MKAVTELCHYLKVCARELRGNRQFGPLLDVETAGEIAQEAARDEQRMGALAHRARIADDEAGQMIDTVLADGKVTPAEIALLRKARRHITASAEADHNLAEGLTA